MIVPADRVKETSTTTGTGTLTLAGAASNFQSFNSGVGDGKKVCYCIQHQTAAEWEVGIGTYTNAGTTLSRTTILGSSNSGSAVNLSAGTKDVFVDFSARAMLPRGHIDGLVLAYNTTTKIDIAAGKCRDDADETDIFNQASFSKTLANTWAAGTNSNGLDTGALAANTWYHVWAIRKDSDGSFDVLFSLSATSPTMPTGYTYKRRIGSVLSNGSSQVTKFTQQGDSFLWDVPVEDVNTTNPGTSAVLRTLSVPTGVKVKPFTIWLNSAVATNPYVLITSPDQADTAPSSTIYTYYNFNTGTVYMNTPVYFLWTNTSAQLRYRASTSGAGDITRAITHGWVDPRGKDA